MKLVNGALTGLRWLDRNIEKLVIATSLAALALIIVMGVVQRFVFNFQTPWTGSIPIYLFMWVTWIGAAYNVKSRTQLRFDEIRTRLPYAGQFLCRVLDAVLWVGVAALVVRYSIEQTHLVHQNYAVVQGTENIQQWWFYLATPLGWILVAFRALQNLWKEFCAFRNRDPLPSDVMIFTVD